jgi:hypothetical protein
MAQMAGTEQTGSPQTGAPRRGFRAWLAHAFAVEPYDETSLSADERQAIERLAKRIDERGLSTVTPSLW